MSHIMFAYAKNNGTDKLISAFVFTYSPNFKPLAFFCGCTARTVSDLVENPEDRFSGHEARISCFYMTLALKADLIETWGRDPYVH